MSDLIWLLWIADATKSANLVFGVSWWVLIFCGVLVVFFKIALLKTHSDVQTGPISKKLGVAFLAVSFLAVATPGPDTIDRMVVLGVADRVAQTELAQELGGDVGELAKDSLTILKDYVSDLKKQGESK